MIEIRAMSGGLAKILEMIAPNGSGVGKWVIESDRVDADPATGLARSRQTHRRGVSMSEVFAKVPTQRPLRRSSSRATLALVSFSFAAALASSASWAGSFIIREQSAAGLGEAYAGVAAGSGGLSSMFWNPATLTDIPGTQVSAIASGIIPYANLRPEVGTAPFLMPLGGTGNMSPAAVLPALYGSHQINDRLWLGISLNAPDGLASKPNNPTASQIYGLTSKLQSGEVAPVIGFRLNDMLSFGIGPRILYTRLYETTAMTPFAGGPLSVLKGDTWGIGVNAGLTFKPFDGTTIGLGYRSRIDQNISGELSLGAPLPGPIAAGAYPISLKLTVPDSLSLGLRQKLTPALTLTGTYEWTAWSQLKNPPVVGSPIPGQTAPFFYRDGWLLSVGGEYQANPNFVLRAGIAFEKSPITDRIREVRNPDSDRKSLHVGLTYRANDRMSFDVGYAFYPPGKVNVAIVPGNPTFALVGVPYIGTVSGSLNILSVGLNYRFDSGASRIAQH